MCIRDSSWSVIFDGAFRPIHRRPADLSQLVLKSLRHLHQDMVFLTGDRIVDGLALGFELTIDSHASGAPTLVKFELDRHELRFEERGHYGREDLKEGPAVLAAQDLQNCIALGR